MDDKLNDSGYGSPKKRPAEKNDIHFIINKNSKRVRLSADIYDTVAQATKKLSPEIAVNDHLFWANIRDCPEPKSISPFTLQCGLIKEDTEVKCEKYAGLIYNPCRMGTDTKSLETKLFFVSMEDRRKKVGITHVNYKNFGRNMHMCVIARSGETYRNALLRDGRFKSVDQFCLKQKVDGGEAEVDLDGVAEERIVLLVAVRKNSKKNFSHGPSESTSTSEEPNTKLAKKTFKKVDYDKLVEKLDAATTSSKLPEKNLKQLAEELSERNVVCILPSKSPSELSVKELLSALEQCSQSLFPGTLFRTRDKRKIKESLGKLAKVHFAKFTETGRPVSFSKKIHNFFDSVGYVKCGSVEATCFLVSDTMIATNFHVALLLHSQSNVSDDALVYFKYEEGGKSSLSDGYKLRPLSYNENVVSEGLDYAFLFLERPVEETLTLGQFVRCKQPEVGTLCTIGHPNGNPKHDDIFSILLPHELDDRLAEIENDPSFYMCCSDIRHIYNDESLVSYDVSCMFEGSSGSPVFDMDFNLLALHRLGYHLGARRFMEVGVKFSSIIEDLESRGFSEFVTEHFPFCWVERMET